MKKSELWIAFAGSQLTSSVSLHDLEDGTMVKVVISGILDEASMFVTNVVLAAMESGAHKYCLIDVQNLIFVHGMAINEHAVDCLVRLTGYAMNHNMQAVLVVDNGYVREVLADTLRRHRGFSRILIQSSCAAAGFLGHEIDHNIVLQGEQSYD